jgi:hypothetical protein
MDKIAKGFAAKGVVCTMLYTREPHAGQKRSGFDFSDTRQTKTHEERIDYALAMMKAYAEHRPILIDTFGEDCIQKKIGGNQPNSLIVVDRKGKLALWQAWSDPHELQKKLEEMTGYILPPEFSTLNDHSWKRTPGSQANDSGAAEGDDDKE